MDMYPSYKRDAAGPERIYLDYAAATPVHPEVLEAMQPYFSQMYGNASAVHKEGVAARKAIETAREALAHMLRVRTEGVVFTGSGTESNNVALYGVLRHLHESGRPFKDIEIIATSIEHPSILRVLKHLEDHGVRVHFCHVDEDGFIDVEHLKKCLNEKTALLTYAYTNSEIGTVQYVKQISRIVRTYNEEHHTRILTHLDASQAPLWLPCQLDMLGVDLMTLDAGKCYGPKGVGVLLFRHGVMLKGITLGGDQEYGLRAGTENTPLIIGAAKALVRAQEGWEKRSEAVTALRDAMIYTLTDEVEGVLLNGSKKHRIANNINISIPGIDSEFAVVVLDAHGIAASTKSACGGVHGGGSYVVEETTKDNARAYSTIRFSLGEESSEADVQTAIHVLKEHVTKMRTMQPQ